MAQSPSRHRSTLHILHTGHRDGGSLTRPRFGAAWASWIASPTRALLTWPRPASRHRSALHRLHLRHRSGFAAMAGRTPATPWTPVPTQRCLVWVRGLVPRRLGRAMLLLGTTPLRDGSGQALVKKAELGIAPRRGQLRDRGPGPALPLHRRGAREHHTRGNICADHCSRELAGTPLNFRMTWRRGHSVFE